MSVKRIIALLLSLMLLPLAPALASAPPQDHPINRKVYPNSAKTLDYLPDIARARTDTLVIGVSELTGEANPFWVQVMGDHYLASLLYDELLFANSLGEIGSGVATFAVSDEGHTYTFTLNENVRYADGVAVSSDDYINALYLLLMPGYDGCYDISHAGIVGVDEYLAGDAVSIRGIQRVSERAFSITSTNKNPTNLLHFAIPALRVSVFGSAQRPDTVNEPADFAKFYAERLREIRATDASAMAYGQYLLDSMAAGEKAVLRKNDAYWRGAPYIGTIEITVVPIGGELSAIMDGSVDVISMLGSVDAVDTVADFETSFVNLYTWEGDIFGYLGMDLTHPVFEDLRVRQALAMGFDREAARRNPIGIERYGNVPSMLLFDSFSPTTINISTELTGEYLFNPERAAALLDDAGWEMGDDGLRHRDGEALSFTLTYNMPNPVVEIFVDQMVADYKELGIEVKTQAIPFDTLTKGVAEGAYEMYFQARRLPASPMLAADLFVGDSHLNASGYTSKLMERLMGMAESADDEERQTVIYELLFQELYLDLPFIPLYRRSEFLLVNARVMNMTITTAHDITADAYRLFFTDTLEGQW